MDMDLVTRLKKIQGALEVSAEEIGIDSVALIGSASEDPYLILVWADGRTDSITLHTVCM